MSVCVCECRGFPSSRKPLRNGVQFVLEVKGGDDVMPYTVVVSFGIGSKRHLQPV